MTRATRNRTGTTWLVGAIAAAIVGTGAVTGASTAHADGIKSQVLIVLAKEEDGTIDPALRGESALRRPPFNSFRSMKVLEKAKIELDKGDPEQVDLPNNRKLRIELQQKLPDGRFRVKVSINRPDENDYLPLLTVVASPGDPFFVAGQSYKGGTLVIGLRIGEKPAGSED